MLASIYPYLEPSGACIKLLYCQTPSVQASVRQAACFARNLHLERNPPVDSAASSVQTADGSGAVRCTGKEEKCCQGGDSAPSHLARLLRGSRSTRS